MEKHSHYFYVLKCADGSLYAGYTNDLQKRLTAHNSGKGAKYTRARRPVELYYHECFFNQKRSHATGISFQNVDTSKKGHVYRRKANQKGGGT